MPVESLTTLRAANSASGSHSSQSSWAKLTYWRRYCSRNELAFSVWPSVSGWYAVERLMLVCNRWQTAFQNSEMNSGPLSETIESGSPCSFHTSRTKSMARSCAFMLVLQGVKCLSFDSLSTTTIIALNPRGVGWNGPMKSTDRSLHLCKGIGRGFSVPWYRIWEFL